MDALSNLLEAADVVITSTAAPHYVITYDAVCRAQERRDGRPLFIADIAVPRDVDPNVARIPGVSLYNIDDLKSVVSKNMNKRRKEVVRVEAIIAHELAEWQAWLAAREAVPLLTSFRAQLDAIRETEMRKAMKKLEHLAPEDREAVQSLTRSIVNKILHNPTMRLKEAAARQDGGLYLRTLRELFNLDEAADPTAGEPED
jgi:glutamyl-tRNA reductase